MLGPSLSGPNFFLNSAQLVICVAWSRGASGLLATPRKPAVLVPTAWIDRAPPATSSIYYAWGFSIVQNHFGTPSD